jgi:hypothetical protein
VVFTKNNTSYICPVTSYDDNNIVIKNYFGDDFGGATIKLINYLAKDQIGNFIYRGLRAKAVNLSNDFIENYSSYAIKITSENFLNNYYFISDVVQENSGYVLSLYGDFENVGLPQNSVSCVCDFYKYKNNTIFIEEKNRSLEEVELNLNRSNLEIIQKDIEIICEGKTNSDNVNLLSSPGTPVDISSQSESSSMTIETKNGEERG